MRTTFGLHPCSHIRNEIFQRVKYFFFIRARFEFEKPSSQNTRRLQVNGLNFLSDRWMMWNLHKTFYLKLSHSWIKNVPSCKHPKQKSEHWINSCFLYVSKSKVFSFHYSHKKIYFPPCFRNKMLLMMLWVIFKQTCLLKSKTGPFKCCWSGDFHLFQLFFFTILVRK